MKKNANDDVEGLALRILYGERHGVSIWLEGGVIAEVDLVEIGCCGLSDWMNDRRLVAAHQYARRWQSALRVDHNQCGAPRLPHRNRFTTKGKIA